MSPDEAFHGKTVVGLFFGRESCPHCGPFLQSLMALLGRHSNATVVFISRCASAEDTEQYFDKMPYWMAMPHEVATGQCGAGLFAKFDLATIPALVLLDGNGNLICRDACIRLKADPTGINFLWATAAELPARSLQVKFARDSLRAPRAALVPPLSLPPAPLT